MSKIMFLYTEPPEAPPGTFPEAGLPAVPWYLPTDTLPFVDTVTFKLCPRVTVREAELDLDTVLAGLCKEYPGIPEEAHEQRVLSTAHAAERLRAHAGRSFKLVLANGRYTLMCVDDSTITETI